jgi:hypothetical protein
MEWLNEVNIKQQLNDFSNKNLTQYLPDYLKGFSTSSSLKLNLKYEKK